MNINYRMLHCFKKWMHSQWVVDMAQMLKTGNNTESREYTSVKEKKKKTSLDIK